LELVKANAPNTHLATATGRSCPAGEACVKSPRKDPRAFDTATSALLPFGRDVTETSPTTASTTLTPPACGLAYVYYWSYPSG